MDIPSLFIVGCGRSGTSLTAGLFRHTGRFFGSYLHGPTPENEKGYFEDAQINQLNNQILRRLTPRPQIHDGITYACDAPDTSGIWLSRIPLETRIDLQSHEREAIHSFLAKKPFCIKDTRFCYLWPHWHQQCQEAKTIFVFRHPALVAASILKNCRVHPHLHNFAISVNQAFEVWFLMNSHVIHHHYQHANWLCVEYEDILSGQAMEPLENFSETPIDREFSERRLNRATDDLTAPNHCLELYRALKKLIRY
ncbi:MAG: sulfotransferase [Acidobacteria bacterium]|nr:sulfotransferase [Acidobacteriota bacterium]